MLYYILILSELGLGTAYVIPGCMSGWGAGVGCRVVIRRGSAGLAFQPSLIQHV